MVQTFLDTFLDVRERGETCWTTAVEVKNESLTLRSICQMGHAGCLFQGTGGRVFSMGCNLCKPLASVLLTRHDPSPHHDFLPGSKILVRGQELVDC